MKNNAENENVMAANTLDETEIKPVLTPKNRWLYPTDVLGLLEKGVEFDSRTYVRAIKENETPVFTIIEK